jgi:hypothetical protein
MPDQFPITIDGVQAVAIAPTLAEDLPAEIREGIARRRLLLAGNPCPCGARPPRLNRRLRREMAARKRRGLPGMLIHCMIIHDEECPAASENLEALAAEHNIDLQRWW